MIRARDEVVTPPDLASAKAAALASAKLIAAGKTKAKKGKGGTALAQLLGLTAPAISAWGGEVPIGRVLEVEKATGIPRHVLRPDVYPLPSEAA